MVPGCPCHNAITPDCLCHTGGWKRAFSQDAWLPVLYRQMVPGCPCHIAIVPDCLCHTDGWK
eukprot:552333-Pelagomonas_calceolata.AAC.4